MAQIKRAAVEDVLAIKDVLSETWHDTYGSLLPTSTIETITSQWHAPGLLERQVQSPDLFFAVARDEQGNVVGIITAREQEDAMVVDRLYVRPPYQRRGVGQQLLESSYRVFPAVRRVCLKVEAQNPKGLAFYRKQGFREVERMLEEVAGSRLETVVMERRL